jgi:signal transduction histidine kinase
MQPDERARRLLNEVTHCLRGPLRDMLFVAENALRREPTREDVRRLKALCTEALTEVRNLTICDRLDSGDPIKPDTGLISFEEIVRVVTHVVQDAALYRNIGEVELTLEEPKSRVIELKGDLEYLKMAIWNMIKNAQENSYRKSVIRVEARITTNFELRVTNMGPPIRNEELSHAFERDWSYSFSSQWRWLGSRLWMVSKLVQALGGTIFMTAEGEFTTVTLRLAYQT